MIIVVFPTHGVTKECLECTQLNICVLYRRSTHSLSATLGLWWVTLWVTWVGHVGRVSWGFCCVGSVTIRLAYVCPPEYRVLHGRVQMPHSNGSEPEEDWSGLRQRLVRCVWLGSLSTCTP